MAFKMTRATPILKILNRMLKNMMYSIFSLQSVMWCSSERPPWSLTQTFFYVEARDSKQNIKKDDHPEKKMFLY